MRIFLEPRGINQHLRGGGGGGGGGFSISKKMIKVLGGRCPKRLKNF